MAAARRERGLPEDFALTSPLTPQCLRMACVNQFTETVMEKYPEPEELLLHYLRKALRLTGIKYGCGIGGCGACTVMVSTYNPDTKKIRHFPANSCLLPLCSLHGAAITTVEGVGTTQTKLDPIQQRLANCHGSQCGFCTPGMVMSMYSLLRNQTEPSMEQIAASLDGNLCRCTGYRPILDSFSAFSMECCPLAGSGKCCLDGEGEGEGEETNEEEEDPLSPTSRGNRRNQEVTGAPLAASTNTGRLKGASCKDLDFTQWKKSNSLPRDSSTRWVPIRIKSPPPATSRNSFASTCCRTQGTPSLSTLPRAWVKLACSWHPRSFLPYEMQCLLPGRKEG